MLSSGARLLSPHFNSLVDFHGIYFGANYEITLFSQMAAQFSSLGTELVIFPHSLEMLVFNLLKSHVYLVMFLSCI